MTITKGTCHYAFLVKGALAAVALASLVGCDTKSDAVVSLVAPLECPDCPVDPYRSEPAVCTPQNGVDRLMIESFDNHASTTTSFGTAQGLYTYQDGTSLLRVEDVNHGVAILSGSISGYEPPIVLTSPCGPTSDDPLFFRGAFHIFGNAFLAWGGGFGVSMTKLNGGDPQTGNTDPHPSDDPHAPKNNCCRGTGLCPQGIDPQLAAKYVAICPPADAEFAVRVAAVDVSAYEGVSFWARRGPNSQMGLRVMVGDKYTDDDLNYLAQRQALATGRNEPTYCRRNRECDCVDHRACSFLQYADLKTDPTNSVPLGAGGFFCGLPHAANLVSVCGANAFACVGANGGPSTCCDTTNCNNPYPPFPCDLFPDAGAHIFPDGGGLPVGAFGDPQFYGRPCTPYAFRNGSAGSYCFDPKIDPPPAEPTELCGDHWMTTVDLSVHWQFFTVPFSNLRQQGWAKKSQKLDLHSVSTVRFTWDTGNIDYWVDDVSFYRWKK